MLFFGVHGDDGDARCFARRCFGCGVCDTVDDGAGSVLAVLLLWKWPNGVFSSPSTERSGDAARDDDALNVGALRVGVPLLLLMLFVIVSGSSPSASIVFSDFVFIDCTWPYVGILEKRAGASGTLDWTFHGAFSSGTSDRSFPDLVPSTNLLGGLGLQFTLKDLMVIGVTVPCMLVLTYFVRYTKLGKAMRATEQDPLAARLMGIHVDRVIAATFAIGGALAGVASVIYALHINTVSYQICFAIR